MFSVVGCLGEHLPRDPCRSCRHLQLPLIAQPPTKLHAFTSRSTGASICNQTCSILNCLPTAVRLHPSHPTVPFRARLVLPRVFLRSNSLTLVLPNLAIECCSRVLVYQGKHSAEIKCLDANGVWHCYSPCFIASIN